MAENKRNWFTTNIHELVHFTKQNAAKAYERLENHIIDWFLSENNLGGYESAVEAYMRTYSKSNPNFTRADAKEEITADSIAALFSTKDGAKSFVHYIADTYKQKSKEIFDSFEEWINNIITSINTMLKKDVLSPLQRTVLQMDKKQAMSIRKEFLSALDEAIKNYASSKTEQKNNTADSGVDVKYSIKQDQFGKYVDVDTDQSIFIGKSLKESISIINKYMDKKFRGKVYPLSNNSKAYVGHTGIDEYSHPARKNLEDDILFSKLKAGTELDNLLAASVFDKHTNDNGHHPEAVGGWDYYTTVFKVGGNFYQGTISIEIRQNGREFKDITKIKRITRTANQNDNSSVDTSNSSINNIPNFNKNVNNIAKNSLDVDIEEYFDDEFYDRFKYEDKRKITKSIEQLEKECDELWNLAENDNSYLDEFYTSKYQLKALKAGFNNVHDYVVEDSKKRVRKYPEQYIPEIIKKREKIKKEQELLHDIQQSPSHKVAQFKIIQANNPAPEGSNYVWIRRPSDIKTLAEAIEDSESFSWGDFTRNDAIKALKRDLITVYSSYPIKQGVFVSTSYIQAQEYAGGEGGRVYSKRIKPSRVAWINGDEGQYASVKNSLDVDSEDTNNPTDSTDIRYSKDLEFKKALTGFEWKKYNESMATEVDEGLRISDNSILVECENDSKYQYKYVIYDDFEDKPMITDVYAIGRIDTDVEDDVPSQCHNIAKFINGVEKQGYDNRKYVRQIYRDFLKNTSYVLARYNMQTSHFYVIGRGSVENGTNTFDKSERGRSAGNDTRLSRDVDFTYESFINKPDMPITVIDDKKDYRPGKAVRESVVNNALESALSVGRKDKSGNISVYVDDIDTDVLVSKKGLRHSLDRRLSIIAPAIENIGSILKKSIKINEMTPKFDVIEKSYVLIGIAKNNNNEPYVVSFVVNRASNEIMSIDILYAVNAKKEATALIEPELSSQSDVSLTASKISISDLLNYVNRYYPDILPEDVLKHYGYKSRPDGKLGESALYSKDVDFSQSEIENLKDENRELRRKNRYLEKANTNLKEQFKLTGGRVLKPNTLNEVATRIKKEWGTSLSKDEIASRIQQMYERLLDDKENMTWETFLNECTAIAQDAWDNQKAPELDSYAKEILTDIRSSKISLTEEQKKETAYHNDTYRDYLRNNFGNIKIANDGVPLDVKWMEWSGKYPDLFNPETTDLFQHILHLSQNINNR